MCVFGCACYPNLSAKAAHKLAPRSTRCVFLGYFSDNKGYRCLDPYTNNIIVSRHVVFYEANFSFSGSLRLTNDLDISLQDGSPGAASMSAPLSVPSVPPGFPPWTAAGTQTIHPIDQTAPEIEAGVARPRHPSSTHSTTRATLELRGSHQRSLYISVPRQRRLYRWCL
jgi:hypothetical protein